MLTVRAMDSRHAAGSSAGAAASAAVPPATADCLPRPVPTRPNLAGLPAGLRPGALKVIIDAQFSGRCRGS